MFEIEIEMIQKLNNLIINFAAIIRYFLSGNYQVRIQEGCQVNLGLIGAWLYPQHIISNLGYLLTLMSNCYQKQIQSYLYFRKMLTQSL